MSRVKVQIIERRTDRTVREVFAGLTAGAGARKGFRVEQPDSGTLVVVHRYCPGWAVVLGIVGLFVFLLGVLLFLVKTEDRATIVGHDLPGGGGTFTVTGWTDPVLAATIDEFLAPATVEPVLQASPVVV